MREFGYKVVIAIDHPGEASSLVTGWYWAKTALEAIRKMANRFDVDIEKLLSISAELDGSEREMPEDGHA